MREGISNEGVDPSLGGCRLRGGTDAFGRLRCARAGAGHAGGIRHRAERGDAKRKPAPESEAGEEHPVTEPPPDRVVPAIGGEGHLCGLPPVDTLGAAYRTGYETFTVRMLQELYGKPEAINGVFFSPASLYMALGMAAEGMRGSTLEQTLSLLAAEDRPALRQGNRELQSLMSGNTKGYFHLANAVWLRESFASCVKPGFLDLNREYYGAKVALHPFDTSLVPDVNRWVSDNTDGVDPPAA